MRKGRLNLYGHLVRVDENRLTNKFSKYLVALKATTGWEEGVKGYAEDVGITLEVINNGKELRSRVNKIQSLDKPPKKSPNWVITEEKRKIRSKRMKRFWDEKRKNVNKFYVVYSWQNSMKL